MRRLASLVRHRYLKRKPRRDPVSVETRNYVLERDRWMCVAPRLGAEDECRGRLTLDHVKDEPRMGKRAPSDAAHLASVCEWHHLYGWATAHRNDLRRYLRLLHPPERPPWGKAW